VRIYNVHSSFTVLIIHKILKKRKVSLTVIAGCLLWSTSTLNMLRDDATLIPLDAITIERKYRIFILIFKIQLMQSGGRVLIIPTLL
jgi:hypothetical protein